MFTQKKTIDISNAEVIKKKIYGFGVKGQSRITSRTRWSYEMPETETLTAREQSGTFRIMTPGFTPQNIK